MTQLRRLKHVADVRFSSVDKKTVDGQIDVKLCNYMDVYYNERILPDIPFMDATATPDQVAAYTLRGGDVLLTKDSETADDIGVSAYVPQDLPGVLCGYHLAVARPRPSAIDGRYLRWALVSAGSRQQLELAATGVTRFGLRRDAVGGMTIPVPSLREQVAIADYLDAETARIDALISVSRRLGDLVNERKTLRIREIVLGDNGTSPRKPARAGWFDAVPASWDVKPLKALTGFINGAAFKPDDWGAEGTPIIRIVNLNGGGEFNRTTRQVDPRYLVQRGDLLFGWSGNRGTSFGPYRWSLDGPHLLNQHIFRLTAAGVDRDWLYWVLVAATHYVEELAHGIIGMVHITRDRLGSILLPVPPLDDQRTIADRLDHLDQVDHDLRERRREQVQLLQERRQALITAAVFGQLDIPGVAA